MIQYHHRTSDLAVELLALAFLPRGSSVASLPTPAFAPAFKYPMKPLGVAVVGLGAVKGALGAAVQAAGDGVGLGAVVEPAVDGVGLGASLEAAEDGVGLGAAVEAVEELGVASAEGPVSGIALLAYQINDT